MVSRWDSVRGDVGWLAVALLERHDLPVLRAVAAEGETERLELSRHALPRGRGACALEVVARLPDAEEDEGGFGRLDDAAEAGAHAARHGGDHRHALVALERLVLAQLVGSHAHAVGPQDRHAGPKARPGD